MLILLGCAFFAVTYFSFPWKTIICQRQTTESTSWIKKKKRKSSIVLLHLSRISPPLHVLNNLSNHSVPKTHHDIRCSCSPRYIFLVTSAWAGILSHHFCASALPVSSTYFIVALSSPITKPRVLWLFVYSCIRRYGMSCLGGGGGGVGVMRVVAGVGAGSGSEKKYEWMSSLVARDLKHFWYCWYGCQQTVVPSVTRCVCRFT